jgi:hypothetical protein
MNIPKFLTGSAGRAIEDVMRVRGYGSASSYAMHAVVDGSTTGMQAAQALHTVDGVFLHGSWGDLINGARPGLRRALGSAQPHFSASAHAELAELRSARSILADGGRDAARQVSTARFGAAAADDLVGLIDQTMPQLHAAARRTAALRVTLGALGVGGAIAGIHALSDSNEGTPMAPGPINQPGAPDLDYSHYV